MEQFKITRYEADKLVEMVNASLSDWDREHNNGVAKALSRLKWNENKEAYLCDNFALEWVYYECDKSVTNWKKYTMAFNKLKDIDFWERFNSWQEPAYERCLDSLLLSETTVGQDEKQLEPDDDFLNSIV